MAQTICIWAEGGIFGIWFIMGKRVLILKKEFGVIFNRWHVQHTELFGMDIDMISCL